MRWIHEIKKNRPNLHGLICLRNLRPQKVPSPSSPVTLPYSMWTDAVGGEAFGQRFLIAAVPFLLLPSGFMIEARGRGDAAFAHLLYAVGVLFNGIAAVTTTIPQAEAVARFPFLTQVLPLFLSGTLDTWWGRRAGPFWGAPAGLIIAVALVLPLVASRLSRPEAPDVPR